MKLLVTGGAGFIGSNFIHYWLKNHPEDEVVNLDKLTYAGHLESLKDIEGNPNYSFIHGDVNNGDDVEKAMNGVDIVVHCAAESHVDRSILDPSPFFDTNVKGTGVLLEAALRHKVQRFHHISTDEVFGSLGLDDSPFNEDTPYKPRSPYAASKASSDHLVRAYFHTYELPVTITNCGNNYGPNQDPEKLISRFITNLMEGQKVPLMGKGENIRDWIFVYDDCTAIEAVLLHGKVGETYCIGGDQERNIDVTRKILAHFGKDESWIELIPDRPGHDLRYALDDTKLRGLGWEPKFDFDRGLEETIRWYKDSEWWWKPLKEGRPNLDSLARRTYGQH